VWNEEELPTLRDICSRHGVLVVTDEMYGEPVFGDNKYTPFTSPGPEYAANCITCTSLAKTFPGMEPDLTFQHLTPIIYKILEYETDTPSNSIPEFDIQARSEAAW